MTHYRERDKLIEVLLRGARDERARHELPQGPRDSRRATGKSVPLTQIADIAYGLEDGIVWRRNRLPTITVRADVRGDAQGPDVAQRRSNRELDAIARRAAARLPASRSAARSRTRAKGQKSIAAGMPLFVLVVLTLLMIQLQSFSRTAMVVLTAPLGLIGVTRSRCSRSASRSASSRCSARSRCPA